MNLNEYQREALKTQNKDIVEPYRRLEEGIMGMNSESGEALDILKKFLFQGHGLDIYNLEQELGDVLWYLAITAHELGVDLETIARININKLRKRYPNGFTYEDSLKRIDTEKD